MSIGLYIHKMCAMTPEAYNPELTHTLLRFQILSPSTHFSNKNMNSFIQIEYDYLLTSFCLHFYVF